MTNYELDVPNIPVSKFRLASVSKQLTAMAIMLLQEQGKLSVHDKISKHMPGYSNGNEITIQSALDNKDCFNRMIANIKKVIYV